MTSDRMRLGIIGMSEGNGHPYSWTAIFNGYDAEKMRDCPFPVIPQYLAERRFPEEALTSATVTHIWTQDHAISEHIAHASLIDTIVDAPEDMIGKVDGLLLARDDAENHARFAMPFLKAGLPIYIDKPLALTVSTARELIEAQCYPGQIFSCTSLRYAKELQLSESDRREIGKIRHIVGTTPRKWDKYAVHIIEPALLLVPDRGAATSMTASGYENGARTLKAFYANDVDISVTAYETATAPISLRVIGTTGWRDLQFFDSFTAFRSSLSAFADSAIDRTQAIPTDFTLEVVGLIEAGGK